MNQNNERVRKAWQRSGLSYTELAKLTGIKRNTLACYIGGRRNPNDMITGMIEEKVLTFLNGGSEYINKTLYRDRYMEKVYQIFGTVPEEYLPRAIMKEFDNLPVVTSEGVLREYKKE